MPYITDASGNYIPSATIQGADGKEVTLRVSNGYIQWKREDTDWANLIAVSSLVGASGEKVQLNANGYVLQYKYESDSTWIELCDLSDYFGNTAAATAAAAANAAAAAANAAAEAAREAVLDIVPAHAASHASSGSDPITPASIAAQPRITAKGLLKGTSAGVVAATANSDYVSPSGKTSFTDTTASTSKTTGAVTVAGGLGVGGTIYADKVLGAAWNDYAEFRNVFGAAEPGDVVVEYWNGFVIKADKRLSPSAMVVSDTFGFCIGKTDMLCVPIAVSGRVLVNVEGDRRKYKTGDVLCAGAYGKASKMRWYEKILFPHRAIGIVSSIPDETTWNDIKINDRVWMKVI